MTQSGFLALLFQSHKGCRYSVPILFWEQVMKLEGKRIALWVRRCRLGQK
jgi:hypothetical protein